METQDKSVNEVLRKLLDAGIIKPEYHNLVVGMIKENE